MINFQPTTEPRTMYCHDMLQVKKSDLLEKVCFCHTPGKVFGSLLHASILCSQVIPINTTPALFY